MHQYSGSNRKSSIPLPDFRRSATDSDSALGLELAGDRSPGHLMCSHLCAGRSRHISWAQSCVFTSLLKLPIKIKPVPISNIVLFSGIADALTCCVAFT